jgi:octopine/nopaline transport system ATP-binding protein
MEPRAMLFDEPTSALDPELVGEVLAVIRGLAAEGRTMILVTHEMKFAREVASHVVFLAQWVVEEQGPPEQVFGAPQSPRCNNSSGPWAETCETKTNHQGDQPMKRP